MKERRIVSVNTVSKNDAITALELLLRLSKNNRYSGSVIESVIAIDEGGERDEAF